MAIKITGLFKPGGNFPLVEDIDLLGGLRVVPTIADRDSIPELNLKEGMLALVKEDNVTYQYKGSGVWEEYSMLSPSESGDSAVVPTAMNKIDLPPIVTGTNTLEETIKKAWNINIDNVNSHYNWPHANGAFFFGGTYENKAVFTIQTEEVLKTNTKIVIFTNNRQLDNNTTIDYTFKGLKVSDNSAYSQNFTFTQIAPDSIWYKGEITLTEDVKPTGIEASDEPSADIARKLRGALWLCQISEAKSVTIPEIEGIIDSFEQHIDYTIAPIYKDYATGNYKTDSEAETDKQLVTKGYIDAQIKGHTETIEVINEYKLDFSMSSNYNDELSNITNTWELPTNGAADTDLDKTNHSGDDNSLIVDGQDGETAFIKFTNDKYFYNPADKYIRRVYFVEWLMNDGHEYAFQTYVKFLMPNGEIVKTKGFCDLVNIENERTEFTHMTFRAELLIPPQAKVIEFGAEHYSGNQYKIWFADPSAYQWKGSYFKIKNIDRILNDTSTSVDPTKELLTYNAIQNLLGDTTKNITWKNPVRVISLNNIDLTSIPDPLSIDDVELVDGDRVALFGQTDATENGIYVYDKTNNQLNRSSDLAAGSHAAGATFIIEEGTENSDTQWIITNDSGHDVVGTDELTAIKISGNAVYMNAPDPLPQDHGGLEAGEIVDGMPVNEVLKRILFPYQYPSFTSFNIASQTQSLEVGDKVAGGTRTFNWSTINDENIKDNSISIIDVTNSNTTLVSGLANDGTEDVDIGADKSLTSPGTYTWRITGENTKNQTFQRDFNVRWYYRVYWGANVNDTLTEADVKNLSNSQLKSGFAGTYNFTNSGNSEYYYIVYPDSWGDYNDWKDTDTGFGVDGTNAGTVDVTNDYGVTITYRMIRTTYQQTSDLHSQMS